MTNTSLYHCKNRACFQRICSKCHHARTQLHLSEWQALQDEFEPVTALGQGQYGYKFHNPALALHRQLPDMMRHHPPTCTPATSSPSAIPSNLGNQELDAEGCLLLSRLGRLPDVITVPVLDWAPGGLGTRFATLYAATIWHMVLSFKTRQPSIVRLYCLIAMYLPALILHAARPDPGSPEAPAEHHSHRSTISMRLRLAENGQWSELCHDLLQVQLLVPPPKESKEALWETKCSRAATRSLAGGWSIAFRALAPDPCPPLHEDTFQKVAQNSTRNPRRSLNELNSLTSVSRP